MTVVISTLYMPETMGADLETTGVAIGVRDLPALRSLRSLVRRATRSAKVKDGPVREAETSSVELETMR